MPGFTFDNAFKYDDSGASYTDVTTAFGSAGTDVTIFDEDDDYIYLGHTTTFNTIEVILATVASNPGVKPVFEYSQGASTWGVLAVSDDTNGFRENGNIFFSIPGDWATDTVNAVASKYWTRIQRTTNSLSTVPTEDTIKVLSSTDYTWDKDGNLTINNITAAAITSSGVTAAAITSSGVMTANSMQIDDTTGDHQYIVGVNELSADRIITLPLLTGNDEAVMKDHAVTMTNKTFSDAIVASGGIQTDGSNALKTKVIDIGDWDMDATANVNVAHGLTMANIRCVSVLIKRDADDLYSPLDYDLAGSGANGTYNIDSTNIQLFRLVGGVFDHVNYDATSYNRGWITITYIA